jgi:hypothetical protein
VKQFGRYERLARVRPDPCRLVRQVKQFKQLGRSRADELLHLPDEPAGVDDEEQRLLAPELLHLPGKPAGVCRDQAIEKRYFKTGASG